MDKHIHTYTHIQYPHTHTMLHVQCLLSSFAFNKYYKNNKNTVVPAQKYADTHMCFFSKMFQHSWKHTVVWNDLVRCSDALSLHWNSMNSKLHKFECPVQIFDLKPNLMYDELEHGEHMK